MKPIILNLNNDRDKAKFEELKEKAVVVDEIREQVRELELVNHPELLAAPDKLKLDKDIETVWIYYPWRNTLVHCLNKDDFKVLRLSRNQNLIIKDEQKKFEKAVIGIAGLNVGNPGAICLALEANIKMKLADIDALSVSNLNRFRAGLCDLGVNKALLSARQIYEINPFAELEVFENGIMPGNVEDFLLKPKLDILIEEMDNLPLKISIRELARKNRIPVIMVTGSGPDTIIDVERFDINPDLPLLNGYLKQEVIDGIKANPKTLDQRIKLAMDFMGAEYLDERLVESFKLVGSKLASIPQLAESSFVRGGALCHFVRKIILDGSISSGRYFLKFKNSYE